MVIDRQHALAGKQEIDKWLNQVVKHRLAQQKQVEEQDGKGKQPPLPKLKTREEITAKLSTFTPSLVTLAGLSDGFNPCAFGTIILFASLLAAGGRSKSDIFWGGISFCGISFLTYLSMGVGLLNVVKASEWRQEVRCIVELVTAGLLVIFGMLSLHDAWCFKRTGKSESITMQLPAKIKQLIQQLGRNQWRSGGVVVAGIICGAGVTMLESVCTGQMYLPTLVYISRFGNKRAWGLLLLYNFAFIVPLLAVFVGVALGVRNQRLAHLARENVVPAKIIMGVVFLVLAVVLVCFVAGREYCFAV